MNFVNDLKILESNIEYWVNLNPGNGVNWYNKANLFAYELANECPSFNIAQICGVIAALSANTSWEQNQVLARQYLVDSNPAGHICQGKALQIMRLSNPDIKTVQSILNGPKIMPFFRNILNPGNNEFLTLDRHAINLAVSRERHSTRIHYTPKRRKMLTEAYTNVANKLDLLPSQAQAISWCNYLDI